MGRAMQRRFKIGELEMIHFYMPGKSLNDVSLKKLHNCLIQIGEDSKTKNAIKLLDKNLTLAEIREHLKHTVVAFGMIDKVPYGFLVHPISNDETSSVIETDFFVLSKNPGTSFNKLMVYGNLILLYERVGAFVATGSFDLEAANLGKVNWYKYTQIRLQTFFLKKGLKKVAADRDMECETIKQIISNTKNAV